MLWLGFAQPSADEQRAGTHREAGGHGHTHGVIDATIATTDRGIWVIKWSFAVLSATALFQVGVVAISGSVALLADTICRRRLNFDPGMGAGIVDTDCG